MGCFFSLAGLLINTVTICLFWRQRSAGTEAKLTVQKYSKNLLLISVCDFISHLLWTLTDVNLFGKQFLVVFLDNNFYVRPNGHGE
jgi:hypothetical protein